MSGVGGAAPVAEVVEAAVMPQVAGHFDLLEQPAVFALDGGFGLGLRVRQSDRLWLRAPFRSGLDRLRPVDQVDELAPPARLIVAAAAERQLAHEIQVRLPFVR